MSDAAALKAQANAAFAAKDFPKASDLYSQAIAVDPTNHVLYSNRSASKASLKDWAGALEDAEKCIDLDKTFVKGYARKGAALHGQRNYEEAVMAYEEGLQIDPNNAPIKKSLADLKPMLESQSPFSGGPGGGLGNLFADPALLGKLAANPKTSGYLADPAFVNKIKELQRSGGKGVEGMLSDPRMLTVMGVAMGIDMQAFERPEGSNEMPEGYKAVDPKAFPGTGAQDKDVEMTDATRKTAHVEDEPEIIRPSAAFASTSSASSSSKPAETKKEPEAEPMQVDEEPEEPSEEEINKKKAAELKAKGTEAYKKRDFVEAAKQFEAAWDTWPGDVSYLTNLSAVYFELGEWAKCVEVCEKAVEEGRSLRADYKIIAKVLGREGSAYEKQGDMANAVKYYNKSLTEHRTPDVLQKLRDAEKAKAQAEKEAYIDPALAEKAREEGNVHFKAGQFADAVKSYTEAIKRLPSDPRGYNNLAAAYTKLAALPEALKASDQAIACDPTFIKAYIRKATVLIGMKDFDKAIEVCQQATEKDVEKKHTKEIEGQLSKAMQETYAQRSGETDEQTLERAMKNPEIASIMSDPVMQQILQQAQSDPKSLQSHMASSPMIKQKVQKLVQAGIIKTRGYGM